MTARLFIPASVVFCIALSGASSFAQRGKFSGAAEIGFDSFTEQYSIIEEDTVTNTADFTAGVNIRYLSGSLFDDYFQIEARTLSGTNGFEPSAHMKCAGSVGSSRFGMETRVTGKTFWENTSYSYPNDYIRYDGRVFYARKLGDFSSIGIAEYLERQDFEQRSEFDYDYLKSTTALNVDVLTASSTSIHGGVSAAYKSIPDSSEIAYKSYSGVLEYRRDFGPRRSVLITLLGERRSFAHKPARSPYWSALACLNAEPYAHGPLGISLESTLESYRYDSNSTVYFDYLESKSALLLMFHRSYEFEAGIGPLYSFLSSDQSRDDRYEEFGGKAALELMKSNRFWASASYEFGRRWYEYFQENPEEAVFSDYFFNRFGVFANVRLAGGFVLNGFLSHEPRNYRRAGDDTSTTLFSADLAWYF